MIHDETGPLKQPGCVPGRSDGGHAVVCQHLADLPPLAAGRPARVPAAPAGLLTAERVCVGNGSRDNAAMTSQQRFTHIARPEGVAPGPGYTHVVTGTGQLVAVSGQVAIDGNGQLVGPGDPSAQARQVFENLRRCLAAAGLSFGEVIKLTYYLTDMAHLPAVRVVRDGFIGTAHLPASTAVQVVALARPELLLEVEAFALA